MQRFNEHILFYNFFFNCLCHLGRAERMLADPMSVVAIGQLHDYFQHLSKFVKTFIFYVSENPKKCVVWNNHLWNWGLQQITLPDISCNKHWCRCILLAQKAFICGHVTVSWRKCNQRHEQIYVSVFPSMDRTGRFVTNAIERKSIIYISHGIQKWCDWFYQRWNFCCAGEWLMRPISKRKKSIFAPHGELLVVGIGCICGAANQLCGENANYTANEVPHYSTICAKLAALQRRANERFSFLGEIRLWRPLFSTASLLTRRVYLGRGKVENTLLPWCASSRITPLWSLLNKHHSTLISFVCAAKTM